MISYKTTDDLGAGQYPAGMSKILNSLSIGGTNANTNVSQEEASRAMGVCKHLSSNG